MKAILINPTDKTITEVEISDKEKKLPQFYKLLGCKTVEAAYFGHEQNDFLYVDEEGLFNEDSYFFKINGNDQPLAGNALVLGDNGRGGDISPVSTLDEIKSRVKFLNQGAFKMPDEDFVFHSWDEFNKVNSL